MGGMAEGSTQERLLNSRKNTPEGIDPRASINAHHSESMSLSSDNNSNKQHSGEVASSKSSNLNRTRVAGVLWISNARMLCLVMALDLMTVSVQVPSLPAVFKSHGMDLRWQGWVNSVYGLISFLMAPFLGRLSDSVGRVHMLKLSALGSMLCALGSLHATGKWSFIAASASLATIASAIEGAVVLVFRSFLLVTRTLPGLMKCSLPISQAYMVDVSEGNAERSKHLGMLGASLGIAFVLGPPLGGRAADSDLHYPFVIAVLEGALLLVVLHFMPEPSPRMAKADNGDITASEDTSNNVKRLIRSASSASIVARMGAEGGDRGGGFTALSVGTSSPLSSKGNGGSRNLKRVKSTSLIAVESGLARLTLLQAKAQASAEQAAERTKSEAPEAAGSGAEEGVGGRGRISVFQGPGGRQIGWGFHDRFFLVVAETLYHVTFAPFLTDVLGFPTGTIGELLSFMGAISALTNVFLVGFLTERVEDKPLMTTSLLVLAVGWMMWSAVTVSTISILAALTMVGVGGNVFQTVSKAAVAQHAPPELVGTVMGMSGAMETFGRTLAGPMCGYMFNAWGARRVPVTCACAAAYVALALAVRGFAAAGDDLYEGKCSPSEIKRRRKERDH